MRILVVLVVMLLVAISCCSDETESESTPETILISGATGRTGSLIYLQLKRRSLFHVQALVRNVTKARLRLGCKSCNAEEGIFLGDVRTKSSLVASMQGVDALVIAVSSAPVNGSFPKGETPYDIDFIGCINQVDVAIAAKVKRIVLISSMGTTFPAAKAAGVINTSMSNILFYKLNAEAYLMENAWQVGFTIIKPTGLTNSNATRKLIGGHLDSLSHHQLLIARADVANLIVEALKHNHESINLRFDIVASESAARVSDFKTFFKLVRKEKLLQSDTNVT